MYESNADVDTPPDDAIIWRYIGIEKLLALLNLKSLYFCRLDRMRDPWEGHWPKPLRKAIERSFVAGGVVDVGDAFWQLRKTMFVNCWHESPYESAALWDQYGESAGLA